MAKGCLGFIGGTFFGIILGIIIIALVIYLFAPKIIPSTPCILQDNCQKQRVCCQWRCDSKDLSWWKCPDFLCNVIGNDVGNNTCGCNNFKCGLN